MQGPKRISELSQISGLFVYRESLLSIKAPVPPPRTYQAIEFFLRTFPIWTCCFLLFTVGVPMYLATGYETPFETIYFLLVWACCLQLVRALKSSECLQRLPRTQSGLLILANPLLLTSGFGTAYFWIKTVLAKTTIDQTISSFRRHGTLVEAFARAAEDYDIRAHVGAGDLAALIVDAGILCLGMKMFEYRRELAATLGSVLSTCAVAAGAGVFLNVALARAAGLGTDEALAFAAKSATIALGVPAIQNLGGSTTLMSALCIFSGMLFQMAGDPLFRALGVRDRGGKRKPVATDGARSHYYPENGEDKEMGVGPGTATRAEAGSSDRNEEEETKLLAAGVTVGINAAAMGTAHLIERDSRAVACSALSMTIYGGMTVALTALPAVSDLLVRLASR